MTEFGIDVVLNQSGAIRDANRLEKELKDVEKAADGAGKTGSQSFSAIGTAARAAVPFVSALFGAQAIANLARASDQLTQYEARLSSITGSAELGKSALDSLVETSLEVGTSLDGSIALFEGLTIGAREFGATEGQIQLVNKAIQQTGVLSGASGEAISNSSRQLSQALAGGVVRAEEFNSIVENTPRLALEIARGFDEANGSVGELRRLVLDGSLSSEQLFGALENQADDIAAAFDEMPVSIDRAFSSVGLTLSLFASNVDSALGSLIGEQGAVSAFSEALQLAAEYYQDLLREASDGSRAVQFTAATKLALDAKEAEQRILELQEQLDRFRESQQNIEFDIFGLNDRGYDLQIARTEELLEVERQRLAGFEGQREVLRESQRQEQELQAERIASRDATLALAAAEKQRKEAAKAESQREANIEGVLRQLRTEEEALEASYDRRRQIILENTEEDSDLQLELLQTNLTAFNAEYKSLQDERRQQTLDDEREFSQLVLEQELEALRTANELKRELEQEIRDQELADALGFDDIRQAEKVDAAERHEQELLEIRTRGALAYQRLIVDYTNFEKLKARERADFVTAAAAGAFAGLAQHSRAFFELNKAASIANSIVNVAVGVTEALKLPYPANIAAAAHVALIGAGEIATISSQTFQGGGGGRGGFGGGGGGPTLSIPEPPTITGETQTEAQTASVVIQGNVYTMDAEEFAEEVAPAIGESLKRDIAEQDYELIPANSRNGIDLQAGSG